MNPGVYTREPTLAQLVTGLMHGAQKLLRQEVALATHEIRIELRNTIPAVMFLGTGTGIAAIGGWLLILMLVHLLRALTALPLWTCYGIKTVESMQEDVQWIKNRNRSGGGALK